MELSGSSNAFTGFFTAVGDVTVGGSDNICSVASCATQGSTVPPPIDYDFTDVTCDYTLGPGTGGDLRAYPSFWTDAGLETLKDGVFCFETGKLVLSGGDVTGNVTFVACEIDIAGAGYSLDPYWEPDGIGILVFALCDSDDAIVAAGSDGLWDGSLYAPIGQVKVSGSAGLTIGGTVIADRIEMSGSDVIVNGNIQGVAALPRLALIE